jgi:hypothetical protein
MWYSPYSSVARHPFLHSGSVPNPEGSVPLLVFNSPVFSPSIKIPLYQNPIMLYCYPSVVVNSVLLPEKFYINTCIIWQHRYIIIIIIIICVYKISGFDKIMPHTISELQ